LWKIFLKNPNILNKQIGFYIIKICLDEAVNERLKMSLVSQPLDDPDELIRQIHDIRDRMYNDIYT